MSDAEIRDADVPRPVLGLRFVDSGDRFFIARGNNAEGMELNAPLALIYQLCDGNRTVQDITEFIQGCYDDGSAADIQQHVRQGIDQLMRGGAINLEK